MFLSEAAPSGFFFLAPWLVFFPLIGLLVNIIFGGWFAKRPSGETLIGTVASLASGAAFVVSVLLAWSVAANHGGVVSVPFAEWIHIGGLELDWTFRVELVIRHDDAGRLGRWDTHPHLCHRIHARRRTLQK